MRVFGDDRSGNCLKVRWTADLLQIAYEWREVRALTGATLDPEFLALNPAGQVPVVQWDDGRALAQSNAIILYLADRSELIPTDAFLRAKMLEWMFWEQYSHEPVIAVRRAKLFLLGQEPGALDPSLLERGAKILSLMDRHLTSRNWFVGDSFTLADMALLPYTRFADQGGFELAQYPAVQSWIKRCEALLGLEAL